MEELSSFAHEESGAYNEEIIADEEEVETLSVDKLEIEKIVLQSSSSRKVLFKERNSNETISASTRRITKRIHLEKWLRNKIKQDCFDIKIHKRRINGSEKLNGDESFGKGFIKAPAARVKETESVSAVYERKIIPIKFKSSSIGSLVKFKEFGKHLEPSNVCKLPPAIPPKPIKQTKYDPNVNLEFLVIAGTLPEDTKENVDDEKIGHQKKDRDLQDCNELTLTSAQAYGQTLQFEIERLEKNSVKIDSITAKTYKQKLPVLCPNQLKVCPISDKYVHKNVNTISSKDLLPKRNQKLKIEEKRFLETDFNHILKADFVPDATLVKPRWSRNISEVEKRWSCEFLDNYNDRNSPKSSNSSYIAELGCVSSHDDVIKDIGRKSCMKFSFQQTDAVQEYHKDIGETSQDTVGTIDSTFCVAERIESVDENIRRKICSTNSYESHNSTLKELSSITAWLDEISLQEDNRICVEPTGSEENRIDNKGQTTLILKKVTENEIGKLQTSDGYAELIREMTMEPGPSKCREEKKKKSGLRRLLPRLFSPKDSCKDYKKEKKERKKCDERHFSQHQQDGIYTRSPDTMNLNEDIKRNVNLDTSLNGSIIEERLNEIKQELFPNQGITTSTPDHFLEDRSFHDRQTPRIYTANSSLSSIAVDDEWIDQNIITGSLDMKKVQQQNRSDYGKCSLEYKHSFQESRPRFFRNHVPSGRKSAPPSDRYLIRPRTVHPIDRPLPAIPQRVELANYQNHEEVRKHPAYSQESTMNYQSGRYYPTNRNHSNKTEHYENSNRNQSIDSGFNLTTILNPVKMNQQCMVSQSGGKISVNVTKSPKYSPSSSQKSGDYADSNYTPNSSQKSEFLPGSSKSGEYYLNSPWNSCQMSPDTSFNRHQGDGDKTIPSYQVSSNIKNLIIDDNSYDEAPRSLSASPRQSNSNTNQETMYIRGSPNIPLSANLAKLCANVENTRPELPTNSADKVQRPQPSSLCMINSSLESQVSSSTLVSMITSPLTVFMPESNTLMTSGSQSHPSTPLNSRIIPSPRILIETKTPDQVPTLVMTPLISQIKSTGCVQMSTFRPRKAQPTDQILIASPKAEAIGEQRSPSRMELKFPDSHVSMVNSPSRILSAHQNHRHNQERFERSKSPNLHELSHQPPPQAFQDKQQRSVSPQKHQSSLPKVIQLPESIYIERQTPQRVVSPLTITSGEEKDSYGLSERSNMLQASPERISLQSSEGPTQQMMHQQKLQSSPKHPPEIIHMQQRITPQPISPSVLSDSDIFPEKTEALQLRKKSFSPFHKRSQAIYQTMSAEPIYRWKMTFSPVPTSISSTLASLQLTPSIYIRKQETSTLKQIYDRHKIGREQINVQRSHKQDPNYGQPMFEPVYGKNPHKQSSSSKRRTLQHLEAFYWQQKALEDQRTTTNSPIVSNQSPQESKAESQVCEAMYWQQLKKLNEEQQRKIFERNQFEEINEMAKKKPQMLPPPKENYQQQEYLKQMYWQINIQSKKSVPTKPPIAGQKVQNQPVLVVRPQQAVCDQNIVKNQKSKSSSPHFHRNDEQRSLQLPKKSTELGDDDFGDGKLNSIIVHKSTTPSFYQGHKDGKDPPPIFKRGSLISNSSSSLEYGTMGTKRVSFSNQSNSPEIASGNWPTKHGLAPEPPTRKHRIEEKIPKTADLSFMRIQGQNQNNANNIYGNIIHESEYDVKPLPPPPTRVDIIIRRCNSMRDNRNQRVEVQRDKTLAHSRRWITSESESSEAGKVRQILQRRNVNYTSL